MTSSAVQKSKFSWKNGNDVSDWPNASLDQLHPGTLDESNNWLIARDGSRIVWTHGAGFEVRAELIELDGAEVGEPQAFELGASLADDFAHVRVLSRNQRFAVFAVESA